MSPSAQNFRETTSSADNAAEPAWKKELNERLAGARSRRLRNLPEQNALPGLESLGNKAETRAARLAAKVAERYANAPSYSDVLAAEARVRSQAAAIKRELNEVPVAESAHAEASAAAFPDWHVSHQPDAEREAPVAARAYSEAPSPQLHEQVEEEMTVEPLAVNLIEFPRELVAARKMRPRLAEGPLAEAAEEAQYSPSSRKGNAEGSAGISVGPAPANWAPIRLDEDLAAAPATRGAIATEQMPLKTAAMEDRIMAAIFDFALIVAAFAIFVLVFVACTTHPPSGKPALFAAGLVFAGFGLLYHYLFFRYAEGTPGMRYAKIALCTFEDENPTREAMCRRVMFLLLSAAPLGMGFLWAWFDQDRLGWHDRISRMYQRSYS